MINTQLNEEVQWCKQVTNGNRVNHHGNKLNTLCSEMIGTQINNSTPYSSRPAILWKSQLHGASETHSFNLHPQNYDKTKLRYN